MSSSDWADDLNNILQEFNSSLPPATEFCRRIKSDTTNRAGNGVLAGMFFILFVLFTWKIIARLARKGCERSFSFIMYMIFLFTCWLDCIALTIAFIFFAFDPEDAYKADQKLFWLSRTLFIFIGVTFVWYWSTKVKCSRILGRGLIIAYTVFGILFLAANILWAVPMDADLREDVLNYIFAVALVLSTIFRILTTIVLTRAATFSALTGETVEQKKSEVYSYTAISSFLAVRDLGVFFIYAVAGVLLSSARHDTLFNNQIFIGMLLYILNFFFPLLMFLIGVHSKNVEDTNEIPLSPMSNGKKEEKALDRTKSVYSPKRDDRAKLPSLIQRIKRYFKLHWKPVAFYSAFWFVIFFVFMWGVHDTCGKPESAIGASVLISRGSARVIMAMSIGVLITVLPYWLTKLSQIELGLFLPLEENIEFHKFFAVIITVFGWLHTFGHVNNVVYYSKYDFNIFKVKDFGPFWMPLISGIVLLIVCTGLVFTGYYRRKFKKHEYFILPHRLMAFIFVVCMLMHGTSQILAQPLAWAFLLLPLLLIVSDNLIRIVNRLIHSSNDYDWEIVKDRKSTFIRIKFKNMFSYHPGQYAWLWCSQVSLLEYHPFSISSGGDMEVQFMIEVKGEYSWTDTLKKVLLTCQKLGREYPNISIDGPFSSPAYRALYSDRVILVAGNIGITPMLSILKYRISLKSLSGTSLKLIWTSNSYAQISSTLNEVQELMKDKWEGSETTFEETTHFHCTDTDPKVEITNPLIKKGRPDMHEIFLNFAAKVGSGSIHIFICGGAALSDAVSHSASVINTLQEEVKFYVHKESF